MHILVRLTRELENALSEMRDNPKMRDVAVAISMLLPKRAVQWSRELAEAVEFETTADEFLPAHHPLSRAALAAERIKELYRH